MTLYPPTVVSAAWAKPQPPASACKSEVVQRRTYLDFRRVGKPDSNLVVACYGQDIVAADGHHELIAEATARLTLDHATLEILSVEAGRASGILRPLVGASARSGYRRVLRPLLDLDMPFQNLLHQLLDDLAGAVVVASYEPIRAGLVSLEDNPMPFGICAGWAHDSQLTGLVTAKHRPVVVRGPSVPAANREAPWVLQGRPLSPGLIRRSRSIQVDLRDGRLHAQTHFRDSHTDEHLAETVIHEYEVTVSCDSGERVTNIQASPHVLPGAECPLAAGSAQRVVGLPLGTLREHVRAEFVGTSTCTHLNDVLRSLGDAPYLGELLR